MAFWGILKRAMLLLFEAGCGPGKGGKKFVFSGKAGIMAGIMFWFGRVEGLRSKLKEPH